MASCIEEKWLMIGGVFDGELRIEVRVKACVLECLLDCSLVRSSS
jgi:hypothetical protein